MRLIDADRLKRKVEGKPYRAKGKFIEMIDAAPTIETRPENPPCGRWEIHEDASWAGGGFTKCSACGYGYSWGGFFAVEEWPFCPHCGIRMEGEA